MPPDVLHVLLRHQVGCKTHPGHVSNSSSFFATWVSLRASIHRCIHPSIHPSIQASIRSVFTIDNQSFRLREAFGRGSLALVQSLQVEGHSEPHLRTSTKFLHPCRHLHRSFHSSRTSSTSFAEPLKFLKPSKKSCSMSLQRSKNRACPALRSDFKTSSLELLAKVGFRLLPFRAVEPKY